MDKYRKYIAKIQDFYNNEEYAKAVRLCCKLIKEYPNYPDAYFERAMARLKQDKDKQAFLDFEKVLELDPHYPGAKEEKGDVLASAALNLTRSKIKGLSYLQHKIRVNTLNTEKQFTLCTEQQFPDQELHELFEQYSKRAHAVHDEYLPYKGKKQLWNMLMNDKSEKGWKFKNEQ